MGSVYLVDFGAVQEKIRTTFLGGSTIVGTYGYVPFEQFTGKAVPASDYYALGATVLYLVTHKHPADFPTERLRLLFHDSVQASPMMIHLLEGLLEPSVKRRIASPEQVRELLAEHSTESQGALIKVSKPITSKIKKVAKASDRIFFRMPNRTNTAVATLFASSGGWLLTAFLISLYTNTWDSLPFQLLVCLPVCGGTLYSLCKRTVLELTPEWVRLRRKSFGIGSSQCVPIAELQRKDITWYLENGKPVLVINHAEKTLRISSDRLKLTQADIEWLVQEINEYVSTYAKPLPAKRHKEHKKNS
jgi:serine/threonine protein kinase